MRPVTDTGGPASNPEQDAAGSNGRPSLDAPGLDDLQGSTRSLDESAARTPGTPEPVQVDDPDRAVPGDGSAWASPFRTGLTVGLGLLVAVAVGLLVLRVASTLMLVGVAFVLAVSLRRAVDALTGHGWPPRAAIAAVFGGLVVFFVAVTTLVIPPVVEQVSELINRLPAVTDSIRSMSFVQDAAARYELVRTNLDEVDAWFRDGEGLLEAMGGLFGAGRVLVTAVVNAALTLVLTLYLLVALPSVMAAVYRFFPRSKRARAEQIGRKVLDHVGALVVGQVTVAGLNGFCSFLFLTVAGVPYAAALAILTAILGVIPLIGATIAAVVVATVAFVQAPVLGLVVVIAYTAYQQVENYFIAPRIMHRVAHIPDVVTIIAALLGGILYGIVGVILAIPVAAAALLIVREVVFDRQDAR